MGKMYAIKEQIKTNSIHMKTLKMFGIAVIAVLMSVGFASCSKDSNIEKSLKGTKWTATLIDDEGWFDLDFISEETVVLIYRDYDQTVMARIAGSYVYAYPIVDFSITYDDWCNKFKAKIVGSDMYVTWVDEEIDIEVEGLTFKKQ